MAIYGNERLQALVDRLLADEALETDDILCEVAEASCTTGYDNEGSTGYEIFKNGFRLGALSAGRDVLEVRTGGSPPISYFFLGTEDEVIAKIEALAADPDFRCE